MKTIITLLISAMLFSSCKKDEGRVSSQVCYECDLDQNGSYTDAGCHTPAEWDDLEFTDHNANPLDKNVVCRLR